MNKKLGFAIIGCGNIAPFHAKAIKEIEGARLVLVCDKSERYAKKTGEEFQVKWTKDLSEILTNSEIDAVNICTPSGMHQDIAVACARAGKHLIVEKPLEVTLPRCDEIIKAAKENKVRLAVIFPSRFKDGSKRLKEALEKSRFGRIALGSAYIKWYRSQEYYDSGAWRGTWEMDGGGALMNQSIHTIDLLQWFMGEVKSVTAYTRTISHNIEVEDTACAILQFRNNALGVIEGSTSCYPGMDARIGIHGENGTVILEEGKIMEWTFKEPEASDKNIKLTKDVSSSGASDPVKNISHEFHRRQIADMVDAILQNREPLVDGAEGRKSVEIIMGIYESQEKKAEVKFPLKY